MKIKSALFLFFLFLSLMLPAVFGNSSAYASGTYGNSFFGSSYGSTAPVNVDKLAEQERATLEERYGEGAEVGDDPVSQYISQGLLDKTIEFLDARDRGEELAELRGKRKAEKCSGSALRDSLHKFREVARKNTKGWQKARIIGSLLFDWARSWESIESKWADLSLGTNEAVQTAYREFAAHVRPCNDYKVKIREVESAGGKEVYKWTDPHDVTGTRNILFVRDGDSLKVIGGVGEGCEPMPYKLVEAKSCLYCPLFERLFQAVQEISTVVYKGRKEIPAGTNNELYPNGRKGIPAIAPLMLSALIFGLAIFIAFRVLELVSSVTRQEAPKVITELLIQGGKVMFVCFLLWDSTFIYQQIMGPILQAGMDFGGELLGYKLGTCDAGLSIQTGVWSLDVFQAADCFIRKITYNLAVPAAISSSLMCVARNAAATRIIGIPLPDMSMMFTGLTIWCFVMVMSLAFAFYLVDATARLGIIGALMPFLLATAPFKLTEKYSKTAFTMFMNSTFTYMFMAIVVGISVELIGVMLTGGGYLYDSAGKVVECYNSTTEEMGNCGGFDAIVYAINGDDVFGLMKLLDIGFGGYLMLIAGCVFGFKLIGQSGSLANHMAEGGGEGIGEKIGGMAASAATAAGKKVGEAGKGMAAGAAGAMVGGELGADIKALGGNSAFAKIGSAVGSSTVKGAKNTFSATKNLTAAGINTARGRGDLAKKNLENAATAMKKTALGQTAIGVKNTAKFAVDKDYRQQVTKQALDGFKKAKHVTGNVFKNGSKDMFVKPVKAVGKAAKAAGKATGAATKATGKYLSNKDFRKQANKKAGKAIVKGIKNLPKGLWKATKLGGKLVGRGIFIATAPISLPIGGLLKTGVAPGIALTNMIQENMGSGKKKTREKLRELGGQVDNAGPRDGGSA